MRASGSKKQNEHVFSLCLTRQIIKIDRGKKHAHVVARAHAPSIFQECRDYRQQKCRDQVNDQKMGAKLNVTNHEIDSPTVCEHPHEAHGPAHARMQSRLHTILSLPLT